MLNLADGRGTDDPILAKIIIARQINHESGGTVIAPWDVDEIPEDWIDAFTASAIKLPDITAAKKEVNDLLMIYRNANPGFKVKQ